jgi:hypothetical protein
MFHSLLKMFHDGIILTTHSDSDVEGEKVVEGKGEEILYRNKRLERIFDV